jgi:hypothetical protein
VQRVLRVAVTNSPLFIAALVGVDGITMNGNNITTDSFNSEDPNLSLYGRYDPTRTSTNGDVASMYGVVNIGTANINGDVLLGPFATNRALNTMSTISGSVNYDFNFEAPEVVLPDTSWIPATEVSENIDGESYRYVFRNNGDYVIASLASVYVSNAVVRLRITGDSSPRIIRVAGTGSSAGNLTIYMEGSRFTLSGQQIVDGFLAKNLTYFGMPSNTQIDLSGNALYVGTVYAPSAELRLSGGGSTVIDFMGAVVVKTAVMNGHFNFHYDEALMTDGTSRGYVAASWEEL